MVQISDQNYRPFWSIRSGRVTKITPPSPPLSKGKRLRDIAHSKSIGNLILGANSVTVYYKKRQILLQYSTTTLLQNTTEVYYKMCQDFYYKCDSFITKCDSCYKLRQFHNKMRQLLQNATFITNCDSTSQE